MAESDIPGFTLVALVGVVLFVSFVFLSQPVVVGHAGDSKVPEWHKNMRKKPKKKKENKKKKQGAKC